MTPMAAGDEFPSVDETLIPLDEDPFVVVQNDSLGLAIDCESAKDRKNNPSIDIVVGVPVWSLSGSMLVREQTYRGRGDAIWSRQS